MKKYLISSLFTLLLISISNAQVSDYRIGITVGPSISYVRTSTDGSYSKVNRDGSQLKFLIGAFIDIPFKENYFFHSGLNYATRATKITLLDGSVMAGQASTNRYNHEYLQLPLLLKLYTNEVLLDTRVFFNFGIIPEIRLNTTAENTNILLIDEFQSVDLSGNFGGGIERAVGVHTNLFVALNFNIGIINQVKSKNDLYDDFTVKNNMFSLQFGIKF